METDGDGRVRISLPPGTYILHRANTPNVLLPRAGQVRATVSAGHYQDVTVMFDSGIRGPVTDG